MSHLACISLVLFSLTQPLITDARGAGGGGGHGHGHPHRFPHPTPEPKPEPKPEPVKGVEEKPAPSAKETEETRIKSQHEYDISVTGVPANITIGCSYANDAGSCEKIMNDNAATEGKDLQQLVAVALQMVQLRGTEMAGSIDRYRRDNASLPAVQVEALDVCAKQYSSAITFADDAIKAYLNLNARLNDIPFWLTGAMACAASCEQAVTATRPNNLVFLSDVNSNVMFVQLCDSALSLVTTYRSATQKTA